MTSPSVFRIADIQDRIDNLPSNGTFIKPFVNVDVSESMAAGINCLHKISVPWDLTCDEVIYCLEGTFRLVVDDVSYELGRGDMMYVPKDNHVKYECDEKCIIFMRPIQLIGSNLLVLHTCLVLIQTICLQLTTDVI